MTETPDQVHGRLNEAMHVAGYAFERAWLKFEWLLEDDRWKQVGGGHEDINAFLSTVQLPKGASAEQRKTVAAKIKALQPEASQRRIAGALGVSHTQIRRDTGTYVPPGPPEPLQDRTPKESSGTYVPPPEPAGDEVARAVQQRLETEVRRERKEQEREQRREENWRKIELAPKPEQLVQIGGFATITIDPPWDWGDEGDVDQMGRARPTYATMSFEDLLNLPVPDLADNDAHIYLWITNRSLPKGFALLDRWGFRYVTALTWVKPHFGMGNYFRGQTEHVLFGVRGSQPLRRRDAGTVLHAPRGPNGHSSKPPEFYDLVESCSPGPYLEMFARSGRGGWVSWGEDGLS